MVTTVPEALRRQAARMRRHQRVWSLERVAPFAVGVLTGLLVASVYWLRIIDQRDYPETR